MLESLNQFYGFSEKFCALQSFIPVLILYPFYPSEKKASIGYGTF
jgi:hypothetical protein